jgi:hypothetical protein
MVDKLIPAGEIDCRSIRHVKPAQLAGFQQCQFFAGIGGWAFALALAGWPEDRPVDTALFPMAPGLPGRVGLLRGAGNAIVPELAAEFIQAYLETET